MAQRCRRNTTADRALVDRAMAPKAPFRTPISGICIGQVLGTVPRRPALMKALSPTTRPFRLGTPADWGIGRITPLVYNPESDGPPVFDSGVWTENAAGVQFAQAADTGSGQSGGNPRAERPTWNNDDAQDYYFGPRWLFEFEAGMGMYDPPNELPKPRDELAGVIPTDPNGTYQAGRKQEFDTLPAQVAEKGKEFAWFMGEWYADRALGAAANGGVKLLNVAGASLPLWFVTRCGTVIERGSVALGLGNRLDNFATAIGAQTWKQLVPDSPELWQRKFRELLNDGTTRFTFNLDGVDV